MKQLFAIVLLISSASALAQSVVRAQTVTKKNLALAKSLAVGDREQEIWDLFWNRGTELSAGQLKKDARKAYFQVDSEYRYAEVIAVESLGNLKLIHVVDSMEGNGCEHVYNMKGEYLNSMCGTESSEWSFEIR